MFFPPELIHAQLGTNITSEWLKKTFAACHRRISERKISVRRKAFEKARNIFPPVNSNNTTAIIEFPQYVKISAWPAVLLDERSSRVQNVGLGHHGQGKISLTYTEEEKKTVGRRNRAQRDPTSTKTIRITRLSPKS